MRNYVNKFKLQESKLQHQGNLERVVGEIFPGYNLKTNVRKESNIVFPQTSQYLELDVWVPELQISFEFQDVHHYMSWWRNQKSMSFIRHADYYKQAAVRDQGNTLIQVPCWWDGTTNSLVETVRQVRPELVQHLPTRSCPIPSEPTDDYFKVPEVPGVGELMTASFSTSTQLAVDNWWIGEKYDGVRVCWNYMAKTLYSRKALAVKIPELWVSHFPRDIFLDGEIWCGRGGYDHSVRLILSPHLLDESLAFIRITVFDNPQAKLHTLPFEERYATLVTCVPNTSALLILASRFICESKMELEDFTECVIEDGGEGVMLRKPKSIYEPGRSANLLKFKASRADREALVMQTELGGVTLLTPDNVLFTAQVPMELKEDLDLKKGDIVSFSYQSYSNNNIPVNARVYRLRKDLSWRDVVQSEAAQIPQHNLVNEVTDALFMSNREAPKLQKSIKPHSFWTTMKGKNARAFFDQFAKKQKFDPLVATNWYSVSSVEVKLEKHGLAVLRHFRYSLSAALMALYPDIGLRPEYFQKAGRNYWANNQNKRRSLDEFAAKKAFDPLAPDNWYKISAHEIKEDYSIKYWVNRYFGNSTHKALCAVYPEIGLNPANFKFKRYNWTETDQQRDFFNKFAQESRFDPLHAENWYNVSLSSIAQKSGTLLSHTKVSTALLKSYPNIGLDASCFSYKNATLRQQKRLCDSVAAELQFNPTQVENWYRVEHKHFKHLQGGRPALAEYNFDLSALIMTVYPNIGLEKNLFNTRRGKSTPSHQREILSSVAELRGLDPLDSSTWLKISAKDVLQHKGGGNILNNHGSYQSAVVALFPNVSFPEHKKITRPPYLQKWIEKRASQMQP